MKKILCFFAVFMIIVSIPLSASAETLTSDDIKTTVVNKFNSSINRTISVANIQTIIKDNNSDNYYITVGRIQNRDKCEIFLDEGHFVIQNGPYYYSGDWGGSFWLKYNSSADTLDILGTSYYETFNSDGKHMSWVADYSCWSPIYTSYNLIRNDGNIDRVSFDSYISKNLLSIRKSPPPTIYGAELPTDYTVLSLGSYYSTSVFNYCFGAMHEDFDLASISSKLDLIVNSLGDIFSSSNSINSLLNSVRSNVELINIDNNKGFSGVHLVLSRIEKILQNIDSYFNENDGNNLAYILQDLDTVISKFLFKFDDITDMYDYDFSWFDGAGVILQKISDYIDDIIETTTQQQDSASFSTQLSTLQSDSNTIFGASSQLAGQINSFVSQIDGSGTTTLSVGYSTTFAGKNISNSLSISNSWWTPYKAKADGIVAAFMWLVFLFNFFSQLGNILEGNGFKITIHREHLNPNNYDSTMEE